MVAARIIEPTSKVDALRVLDETGVDSPAYRTLKRRLPIFAKPELPATTFGRMCRSCALGPASLILYDVSTLHFQTDAGDGFREPGFSKERRLDPQITLGLLTDATGFPLTVAAFEGNKAETATMLPVINAFKAAHRLTDITVVADAGISPKPTRSPSKPRGCRSSWAPGSRICPMWCANGATNTLMKLSPMGWCSLSPGRPPVRRRPAASPTGSSTTSTAMIEPARHLRGIDEQVAKAQRAVDGHAPVKRNRYIQLSGATKSVNRTLEAKTRALAGWKGYADGGVMPTGDGSCLVGVVPGLDCSA